MDEKIPGFFPSENPILRPPWMRDQADELTAEVVDTRTKLVARGVPPRDPAEPVFFPGGPPAVASTGWVVLLASGERLAVDGPVVVGRKPFAVDGFPTAALVAVDDPGKTVSKNHAILLPYDGGLFVLDLNSTNGVAVVANGRRTRVTSTEFSPVTDGAVIELGTYLMGADKGS